MCGNNNQVTNVDATFLFGIGFDNASPINNSNKL
jgi:hypothetical protein